MKKSIFCVTIVLFSFLAKSQDYKTAFGLRGGFSNGLTIKHFLSGTNAIEGILTTRWGGFNVTGLFEVHNTLPTEGLCWYYGGGIHMGVWDGSKGNPWVGGGQTTSVIGIDGILGMGYTFVDIPLNLSVDWKPAYNLLGHSGIWADNFALSVRYTIK
jgi:hypothetical protein